MTITLTDAAAKIVKSDVTAFKSDTKRYAAYVAEMCVTAETLPEHVAAFRDAFKASTPKATGDQVKAYATKVRNGLKYNLPKVDRDQMDVDYLKKILSAVDSGVTHNLDAATILAAVTAHVESMLA